MKMDQDNGLPVGWNKTLISCVAQVDLGKTPKKVQYCDFSGYKIIKFRDVSYNGIKWNKDDKGYIKSDTSTKDLKVLKLNDVLITASAHASEHIGKKVAFVSRIPNDFEEVFYVGELLNIRANPEALLPKFTFYYFISKEGYKAIQEKVKGVHLTTGEARKIEIPLAPLPEQNRIVAEIEKQFSRLDEAVAGLKRIQANLKRYRASVLKAAVEGRLTAEWRKQHPDTEPAEQLLQRILKERRSQWEQAELEKMHAAGKPPKDDQWKLKYKEPAKPDVSDLPALPEGWVWATISQVGDIQLGKMLDRQKYQSGHELPYLRNINIRWNAVDTTDVFKMFFRDHEIERFGIKPGDVLVCEGGEPGRAAIWNGLNSEMKYQKALHRVRFLTGYEPKLLVFSLEYLARSGKLENWFTGSTIKHFTRESFSTLNLSIPPLVEQTKIVSEVERRLSIADEVEQQINTNLKRAERLRQAILKKAFSGRLVPQNPNDEPASVLLEKIKQAQRA